MLNVVEYISNMRFASATVAFLTTAFFHLCTSTTSCLSSLTSNPNSQPKPYGKHLICQLNVNFCQGVLPDSFGQVSAEDSAPLCCFSSKAANVLKYSQNIALSVLGKCLGEDCKNTESRNNNFPYLRYFIFGKQLFLPFSQPIRCIDYFIPSY